MELDSGAGTVTKNESTWKSWCSAAGDLSAELRGGREEGVYKAVQLRFLIPFFLLTFDPQPVLSSQNTPKQTTMCLGAVVEDSKILRRSSMVFECGFREKEEVHRSYGVYCLFDD
jgi:hypothetical protein